MLYAQCMRRQAGEGVREAGRAGSYRARARQRAKAGKEEAMLACEAPAQGQQGREAGDATGAYYV